MRCHSESKGEDRGAAVPAGPASIRVAVAGNPNAGKTSLFNALTGAIQSVGNYPGVTVERKEGRARHEGRLLHITDLPGTYSLTAYSLDERVARNHLLEDRPDVVVDVVDASNLERNLYLTTQLLELELPLVVALNMVDLAARSGVRVDAAKLSSLLGAPVVPTVAVKGEGIAALKAACVDAARGDRVLPHSLDFGHGVEEEVRDLSEHLAGVEGLPPTIPRRWLAVKLLEGDPDAEERVRGAVADAPALFDVVSRAAARIAAHFREEAFTVVPERRYGFAAGVVKACVERAGRTRRDVTDRIDAVVCHRVAGPLLLVGVVYALFVAVFKVADEWPWLFGRSPSGWMEWFFGSLAVLASPLEALSPVVHSLVVEGLLAGVGGVMGFVPMIAVLFLFVAVLEDSGYIARVAFILDRLLRAFGLQGKSILALIVGGGLGGGGCAVPAVMATRTLREEKDRLVTMLVVPFMNCGAKMPVHLLLIATFFAARRAEMLLLLWALSWAVTLVSALFLRRVVVRGEQTPFVMELPAYHVPTVKGVLLHSFERTWMYVKKAATVILAVNLVLWALMSFPGPGADAKAAFDARQRDARIRMEERIRSAGAGPDAEDWIRLLSEEEGRARVDRLSASVVEARQLEEGDRMEAVRRLEQEGGPAFLLARLAADLENAAALEDRLEDLEVLRETDPGSPADRLALEEARSSLDQAEASLAGADPTAAAAARAFLEFRAQARAVRADRERTALEGSVAGRLGRGLGLLSQVAGFDWRDTIALLGGFAAKEVVVGTLGTAYAMGDAADGGASQTLSERLRADPGWSPLRALSMMLFVMLYAPCLVTLAVIRKETNSWRWPLFSLAFNTLVAFAVAAAVYQGGRLLGL